MEGYLAQLILWAGSWAPQGWMFCQGQILQITNYQALFSLIGTTYGGNGTQTFALPDLRSRVPVGAGQGTGLSAYALGAQTGSETVTLLANQMPIHNHLIAASTSNGGSESPANGFLGQVYDANAGAALPAYVSSASPGTTLNPTSVQNAGGNQPHGNIQPVLGLNYIICVQGIYPSRP